MIDRGARSALMQAIWQSGDYTGDQRPTARATIHRGNVRMTPTKGYGDFASIIFSYAGGSTADYYLPREIPRIKSVKWNRSVDQEIADVTIEIFNTHTDPDTGVTQRGYYTWNRGSSPYDRNRGVVRNEWFGLLVPDNIIRTFEGYGVDWDKTPEGDPHSEMTGTWLIDEVQNNGSIITVKARDFARILDEQIFFPPIVPRKSPIWGIQYPVMFDHYTNVPDPPSARYSPVRLRYRDSSNTPYGQFVVHGHRPAHAFDGNPASYWISVGNAAPNAPYSYEWIEGSCGATTVGRIRLRPWHGRFRAWVSVFANGAWVNRVGTIPYNPNDPNAAPNGANIPAVAAFNVGGDNEQTTVTFAPIKGATRVRVTFTNLQDSHYGDFRYRAGVRELAADSEVDIPRSHTTGNYRDYSDIVKLILAWGGFHWPEKLPFIGLSAGYAIPIAATPARDPYLGEGRIWGEIEDTGEHGVVPLAFTDFDKQPLMSGIKQIRDIVQFYFAVDYQGGAIWRAPNIWQLGNVVNNQDRVRRFIHVLDSQVLLNINSRLSGRNWREQVYVADPSGKIAGGAKGYALNPIGLRRVGGWVDQRLAANPKNDPKQAAAEMKRMAQLIAIRQMMSTREDSFTIPGLPLLQVDDQFVLIDTATGEGYVHYLKGISSSLDNQTGEYTFDCTSQWLGIRPGTTWITEDYGKLAADVETLIDDSDRGRKDGVYKGFDPVVL